MKISKSILDNLNEDILFEMSNLVKRKTGLPVNIWVDDIGVNRKNKHNLPRIKVQNNTADKRQEDTFSLTISKTPEVVAGTCKLDNAILDTVKNYIIKNYNVLMQHWNQEIDIEELKDILYS